MMKRILKLSALFFFVMVYALAQNVTPVPISSLPLANVPLSGTESIPIYQAFTKQISVGQLASTLTSLFTPGSIPVSALSTTTTTINGVPCNLGASCNPSSGNLIVGTTGVGSSSVGQVLNVGTGNILANSTLGTMVDSMTGAAGTALGFVVRSGLATYTSVFGAVTVTTNTNLAGTTLAWPQIYRAGFGSANDGGQMMYTYASAACSIASGAGDNGSQVQATGIGSGCWVANFPAGAALDPRTWGATCGASDSTAAIQAAINAAGVVTPRNRIVIPCPMTVAGNLTISTGSIKIEGEGPLFYPGQSNVPGPAVWPPTTGPALNCTATTGAGCIVISASGVQITNLNLGNPEPAPTTGTYTPTAYPPVIETVFNSGWQGLTLDHLSFTSSFRCIDLEGLFNYNTAFTASHIFIHHIWFNNCLQYQIQAQEVDNQVIIDDIDGTPQWYFNNSSLGQYTRNNTTGILARYLAEPLVSNYSFFALANDIGVDNGNVSNNFGSANVVAAGASFTVGSTTITMSANNPGGITAGMTVFDQTSNRQVGVLSSWGASHTMTLTGGSLITSAGSADNLAFGGITQAIGGAQFHNIQSAQSCRFMVTGVSDQYTIASFAIDGLTLIGDQSGFQCSKNLSQFTLTSNDIVAQIGGNIQVYSIDGFANIGCGTPGTGSCPAGAPGGGAYLMIAGTPYVSTYGAFTASFPFINTPSTTLVSLMGTLQAVTPAAGAGKIMGGGIDGTQAYMGVQCVGGGTNALEGAACLQGARNTTTSGSVVFYTPDNTQRGFMGNANSSGINVMATGTGAVYLGQNAGPPMTVGSTSGQLIINVNGLPTSCTGQPTGTLWDSSHVINVC